MSVWCFCPFHPFHSLAPCSSETLSAVSNKNNPNLSKNKVKQKGIYWKIKERMLRIWALPRTSGVELGLKISFPASWSHLYFSLPLNILSPTAAIFLHSGRKNDQQEFSVHIISAITEEGRIWTEVSSIHYLWLLWLQSWRSLLSSLNTNYWILLHARYCSVSSPWLI